MRMAIPHCILRHLRRQSEAILSLLDRGADAHAKNNKGKRAIDIANDRQIEKDKAYQQLQAASK